jgi:Xaa-Pro aminopeptidase
MPARLARLRSALKRRKIDGLLVTQPENRRFLSGYTAMDTSIAESSGFLIIPVKGVPLLLTDSRYLLQAEQEAAGFEVKLCQRNPLVSLQEILPAIGVRRLGFESHYFLYTAALSLIGMLKKLAILPVAVSGLIEQQRLIKTEEELAIIRKAVALNEEVFQEVFRSLRPGQTERQVALKIENTMRTMGADGPCFETIVASGPNSALPHAVPSERRIREGEPIIIDMGTRLRGYCSDMTRTVVLGRADKKFVELLRIVRAAQCAAMDFIRAGVTAREADGKARRMIAQRGYGKEFGHGLGHGVGLAVHEAPSLNRSNRKKLKDGMVVTVEPGIYLPGWGGIRLENMVLVREGGCEILNKDMTFLEL